MTKLEAWKAWCESAGTPDLATEFTLEQSSHGKAFSFAWERGFVDGMQHQMQSSVEKTLEEKRERLAQPEMQPCAGRNCGSTNPNLHSAECFEDYEKSTGMRAWQGLTDEEIWKCNKAKSGAVEFHICVEHQNVLDFAESIEAKLKEKNT